MSKKEEKLQQLAEIEGAEDGLALVEEHGIDSVVPGICMNDGCDYTVGVEPDAREAWCEECNTGSVASCMVLMGIH